jgi:membrane protease YdiL (CAAX protease family)
MALSAVINAFILVLIPLMLRVTCGARLRDFGLVLLGLPRQIFRGMATYPLLAPLVFGAMIGSLLIWNKTNHPLEDAIRLHHSPGMLVVMVLAGVVFAPLAEELIFRGVLLGWLTRVVLGRPKLPSGDELFDQSEPVAYVDLPEPVESGFGDGLDRDPHNPYAPPGTKLLAPPLDVETTSATLTSSRTILLILANVIVSVIFAGLHSAVWPTPIPIFFLSLGLGVLYQRTGSLIPSMALHMTFNGVSTMLMLLTLGASLPKAKESAKPADAPAKVEAKPAAFVVDLNLFPKRSH